MTTRLRWFLLFLGLLGCLARPALADSWMPAETRTILSPGKTARVTIVPREISGPLEFFTDKVKNVEPAGAAPGDLTKSASARVDVLHGKAWVELWHGPLVNDVAPVGVAITDDGARLITLDNWHMMGWGGDAIIVYGERGQLLSKAGLKSIFGEDFVAGLPHSVSSIHWRGEVRIEQGQFVVQVVSPDPAKSFADKPRYFGLIVSMADGRALPPAGPEWDRALAGARAINLAEANYQIERAARHRAPLLPPTGAYDEPGWHDYLREAFMRVASDWRTGSTGTTVLRPRGAKDYAASVGFIHKDLTDPIGTASIASPDPANLAMVLARELRGVRPGSLKGITLYAFVSPDAAVALREAAIPSSATLIIVNPTVAIPQRLERLAKPDSELLIDPLDNLDDKAT